VSGIRIELSKFRESLRRHPGVTPALVMTFAGILAGAQRSADAGLIGGLVTSVFWVPVLLTAWTGRNRW